MLIEGGRLNSVNIAIRITTGILVSKFIAIYLGPSGMALVGNLRNFLTAIQTFAISGLYKGFVKLISTFKTDAVELSKTLSTVFYFGYFTSVGLAFVCYYNAEFISSVLFSDAYRFAYVIETMALVLPLYALNMFAFSIMNGFAKYKILIIINSIGQILGLLVTLLLIWQERIDGALIALVVVPALNLLITLVGIAFRKSFVSAIHISKMSLGILTTLSPYMVMALVSAIALPIVSIIIRNYLTSEIGITEAGYWTAVTRVSDYYLIIINSILSLYILPRFSEINSKEEFSKEVFQFYKTVIPTFGAILFAIYLGRSLLVTLLFSSEFQPAADLLGFQILGDFMRVLAMVIAYQFLAKKMFMHFIILEIFLFIMLYVSSTSFIDIFGLKGAVMGHCLSYFMYLGILLLIFRSSLFGVLSEEPNDNFKT